MLKLNAIKNAHLEKTPYDHSIVDRLLALETVKALIAERPQVQNKRALRSTGSDKQYSVTNNHVLPLETQEAPPYLSPLWQAFMNHFQSADYSKAVSKLLLYDLSNCFLEITLKSYARGDFISPHTDRAIVPATHILFLNPDWHEDWGGEFTIMQSETEEYKTILPTWDKSIIFKQSAQSWHAVSPCLTDTPRLALQVAFWTTNLKPLLEGRFEYALN